MTKKRCEPPPSWYNASGSKSQGDNVLHIRTATMTKTERLQWLRITLDELILTS